LGSFDRQVLIDMARDRVDKTGRLEQFARPGLLICGTNDFWYHGVQKFAASNPHWKFASVEGLDHGQTWMRSDCTVPIIKSFLAGKAI